MNNTQTLDLIARYFRLADLEPTPQVLEEMERIDRQLIEAITVQEDDRP